jgi:hypothetical protein
MIDEARETALSRGRSVRQRLAGLRLQFPDPGLEAAFREDRFHLNLGNVRFAFLAGIGLWIAWGILLRPHMLVLQDQQRDTIIRFGVFIPMLVIGYAFSFTRLFSRVWEWTSFAIAVATIVIWVYYSSQIHTLPAVRCVGVIPLRSRPLLRCGLHRRDDCVGRHRGVPHAFTSVHLRVSKVLRRCISFRSRCWEARGLLIRFTRQLFLRQRESTNAPGPTACC